MLNLFKIHSPSHTGDLPGEPAADTDQHVRIPPFDGSQGEERQPCCEDGDALRKAGKPAECPSMGNAGFSLIELMVVLLILGVILTIAADQYLSDANYVRLKRATVDLEEISKAIRMYQIREEKSFPVATFTPEYLKSFIGTYFEKEPPLDPWSRPYRNNSNLGVVYSVGPDGRDGFAEADLDSKDDILVWYMPKGFFVTRAEYVDANHSNSLDFGDYIEISFSRPAKMKGVTLFDFMTTKPEKALGSAIIQTGDIGQSLQIVFSPPLLPTIQIGETMIRPRAFLESIKDFSPYPIPLDSNIETFITRKRQ